MNAQEAEAGYRTARSQLDARQIGQDEFNRRVAELKYQDNTGTWWAISPADGSWLKWTGSAWVPAFAQAVPATPQVPATPVYTAPQPVAQQPAAKPSWYIPPVGSQQQPAAGQPTAAQPVQQPVQQPAAQPSWYIPPAGSKQQTATVQPAVTQPVYQQPVPQPAAQPASSYYIPPVGSAQQPATAVVQPAAAAAAKPARNWVGIGSLVLGILSWLFYPYILGVAAVVIGGYSVYSTKKATGKIAFVAIVGIIIGLASIVTDNLYFTLFPPTQGLLMTYWLLQ